MAGRQGGPVAAAKTYAKQEGVQVRYSSVPCALRRVLHASMLPLLEHFERGARSQGLYRHVVSLVANEIAIETPLVIGRDIFLFYTQVYSAVDRYVRLELSKRPNAPKARASASEHFDAEVARFFERHPMDKDALNLLEYQSPVMVRQQECRALATAAHEMIEMFPQRLRRYIKANVVRIAIEEDSSVPKGYDMSRTVACIVNAILSPNGDVDALPEGTPGHVQTALKNLVYSERKALGDVADVMKALRTQTRHFEVLPHLRRISDASLGMLRELDLLPRKEHVSVDGELQDVNECLPCDEESDEDDDEGSNGNDGNRIWTRERRPKSFALLPVAKLQRSMAYYGWTELKDLFRSLSTQHKRTEREAQPSKRATKRKRGDEDNAPDQPNDEPKAADLYPEPHPVTFGRKLFNFRKLKGKSSIFGDNSKSWELSNFRTDGIRAVLTFVSGSAEARCAPHVDKLLESGYCIPKPKAPVDPSTERGLFRITQTRNDTAPSDAWDEVDFVACDPGFCRPVQFASCHGTARRTAEQLAEQATPWHVDAATWMTESGRQSRIRIEEQRRRTNAQYNDTLEALSATRRRCSDLEMFGAYASVAMQTLSSRAEELLHTHRVLCNWKHQRTLQSFLSRIADIALGRQTCRPNRVPNGFHALGRTLGREELLERLHKERERRRENPTKRVVFFGDGTFACTRRGSPSIPKKKLLKHMAVRGLTFLLDECNTSKCCPCGQGELVDSSSSHTEARERVRVHKIGGGTCGVLHRCRDRDALATLNMLQAAVAAVRHESWPLHLLRRR